MQIWRNTSRGAAALWLAACCHPALADYRMDLTAGVTEISRRTHQLHTVAYWVCVAIGVVVFGAMFWSIFHHRKSRGATPALFHENGRLELVWTVIPFLILVALAVPATSALIAMKDTANADLTIKVTGEQWRWRYDYLEDGIRVVSNLAPKSVEAARPASGIDPRGVDHYLLDVDAPLVVPAGKKVRFLLTASDVIHSWWVPDLGFKKDAIPGFINEVWARVDTPGTYRGQCTELCGIGHAYMPIVLVALPEAEFQTWLTARRGAQSAAKAAPARTWSKAELMAKGKEVYTANCVACHQPQGQGIPGVFKPLVGSPLTTGPIAGHIDRVMNGKPGTAMQAFATKLNDDEMAAVITFERNSWGNAAGIVQPAQIKAARK